MIHDIYLLQLGFHLAVVVGNLVQKYEKETKHGIYKTETQTYKTRKQI